jgi:hypothetical protein
MASDRAAAVMWFRADLRLADNPALCAAVATGRPVLCVYVHDETSPGLRPIGAAARWWLGRSLAALDQAIARKDGRERPLGARGGRLVLRRGPAAEVIPALVAEAGAASLHFNRALRRRGAGGGRRSDGAARRCKGYRLNSPRRAAGRARYGSEQLRRALPRLHALLARPAAARRGARPACCTRAHCRLWRRRGR